MKILLFGANGQVGWELQRSLSPLAEIIACDRQLANLENPDQLRSTINHYKPNIIVNAAAYTAVDKAENNIQLAERVNHESVAVIAEEAFKTNALLIHYSTDYIFDGTKECAYTEKDQANPQSVYGTTKHKGELAIHKSGCKHLIFRTSWVFARRGNNFIKTILKLAQQRDHLSIVNDQFGSPCSASLIADVTALSLHQIQMHDTDEDIYGTYHLTPKGKISWYDFALHIISKATQAGIELKITRDNIKPIATHEYPLPAKRPTNSKLSTKKIETAFNLQLPFWETGANLVLDELFESMVLHNGKII